MPGPPCVSENSSGSLLGILAWPLDATSVLASGGARERKPVLSGSFGLSDVSEACWEALGGRSVGVIPTGPRWASVTAAHGQSEENTAFKHELFDQVLLVTGFHV